MLPALKEEIEVAVVALVDLDVEDSVVDVEDSVVDVEDVEDLEEVEEVDLEEKGDSMIKLFI
jgi:hypothetical protein